VYYGFVGGGSVPIPPPVVLELVIFPSVTFPAPPVMFWSCANAGAGVDVPTELANIVAARVAVTTVKVAHIRIPLYVTIVSIILCILFMYS
jgi:hypothetical protein